MAACFSRVRDKIRSNGGLSNVNWQDAEDPQNLVDEFHSLYNEKLKEIEKEFPETLEPKCQALTELVSDLSEQNNMLLKTVEELEKEAISQIDAFSNLAVTARDTIQQDPQRGEAEDSKSFQVESNKVSELQEALKQNENHLATCMLEVERLTSCMSKKDLEFCKLKKTQERMGELEKTVSVLENDLKDRSSLVESLQTDNERVKRKSSSGDIHRLSLLNHEIESLRDQLKQKTDEISKCKEEENTLKSQFSRTNNSLKDLEREWKEKALKYEKELEKRKSLPYDHQVKMHTDSEKNRIEELSSARVQDELAQTKDALDSEQQRVKQLEEQVAHLRTALLNAGAKDADALDSEKQRVKQLEDQVAHLRTALLNDEAKDKDALDSDKQRVKQLEEQVAHLQTAQLNTRAKDADALGSDQQRVKQLEEQVAHLRTALLNAGAKDADALDSEKQRVKQLEDQVAHLRTALLNDEAKDADALDSEKQRVKQLEEQVAHLQTAQLNTRRKSSSGDIHRISLLSHEIESLRDQLKQKTDEISKCKEEEDNLKFQLSRTNNSVKDLEREWKEKALKYEKELEKMKSLPYYDHQEDTRNRRLKKNLHKDITTTNKSNVFDVKTNSTSNIEMLKFKLKDIQEALTGEIADKHDEIRRLKDDVKELEEKLLHSDKQTQFKDDIIKELRKEVKIGRAKESLAEMLGLKGTPRAAMKTRIDYLTCQLEEMRTHVVSLEERLGECNLPAVISLKSRLSSAEGSLLAMCNKMDYVRRYLENLKGDEELSIKCGLEALLSELRDDVEWNRQTRRNLSLDEGTSVIVISHRSHSLPDNSFHRLVSKTKSNSAVITASRQPSLHSKHSLESFEESRNYVAVINELENDFEETCKNLNSLWNEFQSYTKGNGDCLLNEMNNILLSFDTSKTAVTEIVKQMENVDYYKENDMLCYHLHCLKGNLQEISESLSKAYLISSSSEPSFHLEAGDAGVKQKLSTAINDSLSIIQVIENLKNDTHMQYKENAPLVENNLSDIVSLIKSVLEEKENFFEKIATVQRQQFEFSQTLMRKMMEFEKGFCNYNSSAECLKKETRKLFAIILAKEKQLQKQFVEIDNLKMALSSNKYVEEASKEIDSLCKVVSNKDLQLDEKQDLINDLRSLNNSLQKRNLSQSSSSLSLMAESHENVIDKSHQLEKGVLSLKEKISTMSEELVRSEAKMHQFEHETRSLVEALTKIHQELPTPKESTSENLEQLSRLSTSINEAENKGEELLQALESFIFEEQPDFQDFTHSVNDHIESLLDITENIKRSSENERLSMKSIKDENNTMKQQLSKLLNRLTLPSSRKTEIYDRLPSGSEDRANKQFGVHAKDDFTKTLKKGLSRSDPYLEKMQVRTSLAEKTAKDIAQSLPAGRPESQAQRRTEAIAPGSPIGQRERDAQRRSEGIVPSSVGQQERDAQRRFEGIAPGSPVGQRERDAQRRFEGIAPGSPVGQRERDAQRRFEGIAPGSPVGLRERDAQRRTEGITPGSSVRQREWDARRGAKGIAEGSPVGQRERDAQKRAEGHAQVPLFGKQEWDAQQRAEGIAHDSYQGKQEWDVNIPFYQDAYGIEPLSCEEHEIEEVCAYDEKDYVFQSLQEDLSRSHCYLQKMQEEYTSLKLEKAEMEERNQKVMEELQAKVCKLQAASQNQEPEANFLYQLHCIIEQQSQKFEEAKQYILELEENHSENQLEIKTLKNELNTLQCGYNDLLVKFEEAKEYIIEIQEKLSEKENESDENRLQILIQQNKMDELDQELMIKSEQLEELQITREISNASINSQLQELMELKEKVVCWENLMLHLKKEISNRSDQAEHWLRVSNKQKENLTNLITENHLLKTENDKHENEKTQLLQDLEANRKELCELTEVLVNTRQTMMKLNQEKGILEHINSDLQKLLQEKQRFVYEVDESVPVVDKNILQEQEDFIELLIFKITHMNSFIADRDETINILQTQLQMSTMLMLDNVDAEDSNNDFCSALNDVMDKNTIARAAAYKMKLWQSLEVNRRLLSMIDSLQHINYSLLREKMYTNKVEESLPVEQYETNG